MQLRRISRIVVVSAMTLATTLLGVAEGGAAERRLLFYNHSYGVLDRETADAVEHSAYLRDFANFQVRTTTGANGEIWTGRYLMGRETYLELFGVGDLPGQDGAFGSAGLGISTEQAGDLGAVVDRLHDQGVPDPVRFRQTRDFGDGVAVPWFDAVYTADRYDAFGAWAMEYLPEYFADPRGGTGPADHPGDVGRERYLPDGYRDHLVRDVTGVHLAITEQDLASTVPLLRAGGYAVRHVSHGGVVAWGGGTSIRFDAVTRDQAGLRRVDFTLNHAVGRRSEVRIGRSTLVVGPGAGAVWTFDAGVRGR